MILAGNKKAFFDYFIEDKFEAGIELVGSEVKSAKAGKISIKESFIRIINGEIFIMGMSIVPWGFGSVYNPDERRVRKLLLHKKEIKKLHEKALARGKKNYDKRESLAKKDVERDLQRMAKER